MITRTFYDGMVTDQLDVRDYVNMYYNLDSLGDRLAAMGINYKVPLDFILKRVDDQFETKLVKFGCPVDLAKDIVYEIRTNWNYGLEES